MINLKKQKAFIREIEKQNFDFYTILNRYKLSQEDLFKLIENCDPTAQKYLYWIFLRFIKEEIILSDLEGDLFIIKESLTEFNEYSRKQDWIGFKSINRYQTKNKLFNDLDAYKAFKNISVNDIVNKKKLKWVDILDRFDNYIIIKITDPESASILCNDSKWCIRHKETAQKYLMDGPLFLLKNIVPQKNILCFYGSPQNLNRPLSFCNRDGEELEINKTVEILNKLNKFTGFNIENHIELKYFWFSKYLKLRNIKIEELLLSLNGIENVTKKLNYILNFSKKGRNYDLESRFIPNLLQHPFTVLEYMEHLDIREENFYNIEPLLFNPKKLKITSQLINVIRYLQILNYKKRLPQKIEEQIEFFNLKQINLDHLSFIYFYLILLGKDKFSNAELKILEDKLNGKIAWKFSKIMLEFFKYAIKVEKTSESQIDFTYGYFFKFRIEENKIYIVEALNDQKINSFNKCL